MLDAQESPLPPCLLSFLRFPTHPRLIPPYTTTEVASRLFFADDRDGEKLTMEKFSTFVQILQQEALVMQFHQWDRRGDGTLSATDFAKFLATKVRATGRARRIRNARGTRALKKVAEQGRDY